MATRPNPRTPQRADRTVANGPGPRVVAREAAWRTGIASGPAGFARLHPGHRVAINDLACGHAPVDLAAGPGIVARGSCLAR